MNTALGIIDSSSVIYSFVTGTSKRNRLSNFIPAAPGSLFNAMGTYLMISFEFFSKRLYLWSKRSSIGYRLFKIGAFEEILVKMM